MKGCGKSVKVEIKGESTEVPCGTRIGKAPVIFCDACEKKAHRYYWQGWQAVPGDTCRHHGIYIGEPADGARCWMCQESRSHRR